MTTRSLLLLMSLMLSKAAFAGVYQCADGTFSDRPCADPGGKSVNLHAAPQAPAQFDGLAEIQSVDVVAGHASGAAAAADTRACNLADYQTKAAIEQGIRSWSVSRCMTMDQVERVTRRAQYDQFRHINGNGQEVVEWVYNGLQPGRVIFVDGRVVDLR
ncbi:MAG: hypothetical protein II007_06420 [Gammaproteobacteria bacterium]|nr:hypothetical protein [Gammaproteobacteria bacterium]